MKNLLKNRIVIGLICIILSLIICFGLTPMFNNALKSKVSLVRVNTEIHKGVPDYGEDDYYRGSRRL